MGKMNDMLIDRNEHDDGYIQFLEEQLEKAEELIARIKKMTNSKIEISKQKSKVKYFINSYYNDKK